MDLFDTNNEKADSTEGEATGMSNYSTQSPSAQVVNEQHVITSVSSLHVDGSQALATHYASNVVSDLPSTVHFNATSSSFLVQTASTSCAAASQATTPQANTTTLASAQIFPSCASSTPVALPLESFSAGFGAQSANDHYLTPQVPRVDPSGSAMDGISYDDHFANIQSPISQTVPSTNQGNVSFGLLQNSHTVDMSPSNISAVGYSATFSNSENANANANANMNMQNLPPVQINNVADSSIPIAPTNSRVNNQRGTSLAAADHRTSTLTAAYQTYHQTYLASNQSRAAVQVNANHGVQANTAPNTVPPVQHLVHAINPGQATNARRQADALRALVAQVNQVRTTSPRVQDPLNHAQGPFLDRNDPVSVEISQLVTNLRAMTEHRHQAHAAAVDYRSSLFRQVSRIAPPIQTQSTNQPIDSQAANQGPASSNGTLQTGHNAFDAVFQVIGDQDIQLASAGLDNRGNLIQPRPIQLYTENNSLQAYLIRQQLVAGIPPDEVVPMSSFSTQQRLLHGGPMRACDPALIRVQRSTGAVTIPRIPRARFNGRIDALPFDMQGLNPALSRNTQTTPSNGSFLQLDGDSNINQGTLESAAELLHHVFPDDTQQTTENDVVMDNFEDNAAE
ncbi:hypothetical protein N7451_008272 [Penicillium sp. IBT 35674x]|nr:hypothetical protein N7451_008272 [Penicillium sp. IBT 35674x]